MSLSWQLNKAKPMGLQKQEFGYGHLLTSIKTDEDSDITIFAPPKSDSSRASSSELSSLSPEPDTPPLRKRRKLELSSSQHVEQPPPTPIENARGNKDLPSSQASDIRPTQFTSSDPSNYRGKSGGNKRYSNSGKGGNDLDQSRDPFADFHASQSKAGSSYRRPPAVNFHKAVPTKSDRKVKKEPAQVKQIIQEASSGFKTVDIGACHSFVSNAEQEHSGKDFEAPIVLSPSPRSKRASRRSGQNAKKQQKPAQDQTFRKPPRPPSPKVKKSCTPPFVMPPQLSPRPEGRPSNGSERSPQDVPSLCAADLETIKAKLNLDFNIPPSSAALSSGPSFEFDVDDSKSSSLSSAPEVEELDAEQFHQEFLKDHPPSSPKTQCPICKDPVSRLFMEESVGTGVLTVRQQQKFCKAHKFRSAEDEWRTKGYPKIDWPRFAERLTEYDTILSGILNGTQSSFYKNAFEDQMKAGGNRTLQQALMSGNDCEGLNMGYYGTKGARIIMDYAMSNFASRIRKRAGTDKLVSTAGVSGFVQAVLAPELAVMLVMNDMEVDEERARVILKESSDIGHLLNEEEDETIKDVEDEEVVGIE